MLVISKQTTAVSELKSVEQRNVENCVQFMILKNLLHMISEFVIQIFVHVSERMKLLASLMNG